MTMIANSLGSGQVGEPVATATWKWPQSSSAVLLLVDGLGASSLDEHAHRAPFLSALDGAGPDGSRSITAGFPTTTATSLGCLGVGAVPGQHGIVGYRVAIPGAGRLMSSLAWDAAVPPGQWQPLATVPERAGIAGVQVVAVGPAKFADSGLNRAVLRGAPLSSAQTAEELVRTAVALANDAVAAGHARLTYVYWGGLDAAGHRYGVASSPWRQALAEADRLARTIAGELPAETDLYVTADHGMVDVAERDRLDVADRPELRAEVEMLGGEARARFVYAPSAALDRVRDTWRSVLGDRAVVLTRQQALAEGLFGPTWRSEVLDRIGDLVVVMRGAWSVVDSAAEPAELLRLVGVHGSLTADELYVPLLHARR
ncbi:MAG: alkaline phosphatase family protein [Actinomycetes bacterium]